MSLGQCCFLLPGDIKPLEDCDFNLSNVREVRPQGGTVIKNEYYLHPRAFKICLMRSKNKKEYAYYYILLEECIKYFNDYQIELNKKYIIKLKNTEIIIKDDKIDKLLKKTDEQNLKIDNLLKANEELLIRSKRTEKHDRKMKQQIEDITINLDDIKEELTFYKKIKDFFIKH